MRLERRQRRVFSLTAYAAVAGVDVWLAGCEAPRAKLARCVTKPLLMPLLATSLANSRNAAASPLVAPTLAAQAGGWLGDVLLLGEGTEAFAAGAGAFGLGHGAYIAGFRSVRRTSRAVAAAPSGKAAAALALTAGPVMAVGAAREDKVLGPAVAGYVSLISAMLANAGNLRPSLPARSRALILAGATTFVVSDTLLATKEFWWRNAPARAESAVMATYTLAQLLLSEGAAAAV